jgi:Leucine-rich repeat (LRR) protein
MIVDLSSRNLTNLDVNVIPKLDDPFVLNISDNEISSLPDLRSFNIKELIVKNNPIADDDFVFLKINSANVGIGTKVIVSSGSMLSSKLLYSFLY